MENYNGILQDPRPTELKAQDHILGANSPIVLIHKIDLKHLPDGERQSIPGVFDDMSCTTHSSINILNTILTHFYQENLLKPENKKFLEDEGYVINGKVQLSTVFSSTLNGTTIFGNYFQKVWDYHRNIGVLPYADLPNAGRSFEEYHDIKKITAEHRAKAMRFRQRFEINYAWLPTDNSTGVSQVEESTIKYYQEYAPLQIGSPIPATHAMAQPLLTDTEVYIFDTYPPFYRKAPRNFPVNFYLFGYVTERAELLEEIPVLQRILKLGMSGGDVKLLQSNLRKLGYFSFPTDTGLFGTWTLKAVQNFQKDNGIDVTGNYGPITHTKLYKILNK